MTFVVGIDIGGTFTDGFASDQEGRLLSGKTPSTPPDYSAGLVNTLTELAAGAGMSLRDFLAGTDVICHGTTSTLNALVTGNVAQVGFITTRGHADTIAIMNAEGRHNGLSAEQVQDLVHTDKPAPLVSRRYVREVAERVDYKGEVIVPLDEAQARQAIQELLDAGAEAIAVSLLWGFLNPQHERRIRELVDELRPGTYVGLASELSPRIREYARAVTTIMSTQVAGRLRAYLEPLERRLTEYGFRGKLLVMQGSGGVVSSQEAPNRAITTIGSVLTGGIVGCTRVGELLGHANIISTDMGGTTFLAGLVVDREPGVVPTTRLGQYSINTPTVNIHTIGSGGGAIAHLDRGGNLRVGPDSAAAVPGPACYGAGGTEPAELSLREEGAPKGPRRAGHPRPDRHPARPVGRRRRHRHLRDHQRPDRRPGAPGHRERRARPQGLRPVRLRRGSPRALRALRRRPRRAAGPRATRRHRRHVLRVRPGRQRHHGDRRDVTAVELPARHRRRTGHPGPA
jgi:N-methylhydantoinase A